VEVASGCAGSGRNFLLGHRTVASLFLADASAGAAWGHCSSVPACSKGPVKGGGEPARPGGQPALLGCRGGSGQDGSAQGEGGRERGKRCSEGELQAREG